MAVTHSFIIHVNDTYAEQISMSMIINDRINIHTMCRCVLLPPSGQPLAGRYDNTTMIIFTKPMADSSSIMTPGGDTW